MGFHAPQFSFRELVTTALSGLSLLAGGKAAHASPPDLPLLLKDAESGEVVLSLAHVLPSGEGVYRLDFPIHTVLTCRTWRTGPIQNPIGIPDEDSFGELGGYHSWFRCETPTDDPRAAEWSFQVNAERIHEPSPAGGQWIWRGLLQTWRDRELQPALALVGPPAFVNAPQGSPPPSCVRRILGCED